MQSVAVDPLRGRSTDGDRDGARVDPRVCAFPLTAAQQLGIADPLQVESAGRILPRRRRAVLRGHLYPPRQHPRPWRTRLRAGVARSDPGLRPARSSRRREEPVRRAVPGAETFASSTRTYPMERRPRGPAPSVPVWVGTVSCVRRARGSRAPGRPACPRPPFRPRPAGRLRGVRFRRLRGQRGERSRPSPQLRPGAP